MKKPHYCVTLIVLHHGMFGVQQNSQVITYLKHSTTQSQHLILPLQNVKNLLQGSCPQSVLTSLRQRPQKSTILSPTRDKIYDRKSPWQQRQNEESPSNEKSKEQGNKDSDSPRHAVSKHGLRCTPFHPHSLNSKQGLTLHAIERAIPSSTSQVQMFLVIELHKWKSEPKGLGRGHDGNRKAFRISRVSLTVASK